LHFCFLKKTFNLQKFPYLCPDKTPKHYEKAADTHGRDVVDDGEGVQERT
jgi:hypothetical protein